jgi:hypothetical protein
MPKTFENQVAFVENLNCKACVGGKPARASYEWCWMSETSGDQTETTGQAQHCHRCGKLSYLTWKLASKLAPLQIAELQQFFITFPSSLSRPIYRVAPRVGLGGLRVRNFGAVLKSGSAPRRASESVSCVCVSTGFAQHVENATRSVCLNTRETDS